MSILLVNKPGPNPIKIYAENIFIGSGLGLVSPGLELTLELTLEIKLVLRLLNKYKELLASRIRGGRLV